MDAEVRRLHPASWLFIAAGTVRALIFPLIGAVIASGGVLLSRFDWLTVVLVVPSLIYAIVRQRVYSYRFSDGELVVRDGLLTRNVRQISYERIHNVALVRNPIHRMLGVATARIETAAGGRPEALLRVLSLEAADELRRRTLGHETAAPVPEEEQTADEDAPLVQVPNPELVRLGLISNRGFLVVAAALGAMSQVQWWEQDWVQDQDWLRIFRSVHDRSPEWLSWLFDPGRVTGKILITLGVIVLFLIVLRLLSIVWYLVRYHGFTLTRENEDLRAEYGMFTQVSSLIPCHRIQLVTVTASFLHRWFGRSSIDIEIAGASQEGSDLNSQLAASGVNLTRQWLAPIMKEQGANALVHEVMPEVDLDRVRWQGIHPKAVGRLVKRVALVLTPVTLGLAAVFTFAPVRPSGWHSLLIPAAILPVAYLGARRWVRRVGYALDDRAIYFKSGLFGMQTSAVRFVNMQTVSMEQSPFDRRRRMATLSVDTAGAGNMGHRVSIPFLDVVVATEILQRLHAENCGSEFRW